MMLRALPKPNGFELRNARAAKLDDGSKWLPHDALYDASEALTKSPPEIAFLIAWYTRTPDGKLSLKFRAHYEHDRQAVALAADLLREVGA